MPGIRGAYRLHTAYSIPIHIVIFANDTDTFPILIVISSSKFVIKKIDIWQQNHILLPINNLKVGRCVISNNFSWVFLTNYLFNRLNNMYWPSSFVSFCFLLTTEPKMKKKSHFSTEYNKKSIVWSIVKHQCNSIWYRDTVSNRYFGYIAIRYAALIRSV